MDNTTVETNGQDTPAGSTKHSVANAAEARRALWAIRGLEDVYFQREAQVTWWSILGGLAVGALLTQLSPVIQEMQSGRWYLLLYYVSSVLIIVISWLTTVWASLILKWPIVPLHVLLIFLSGFATAVLCLLVTTPALWFLATALYIVTGLLVEFYDLKADTWVAFPPEAIRRSKATMVVHGVFLLLAVAGSVMLLPDPSHVAEAAWGVIALAAACLGFFVHHLKMKRERQLALIP